MSKSSVIETIMRFTAETGKSFDSTFSKMQKQFSTVGKSMEGLSKIGQTAGKVVGTALKATAAAATALGGAVAAGTVMAVNQAANYQTQLQNVATLLDGTEAQVAARTAEIGKDILKVSNDTRVVTADLTDGMYQVVSAFGDSEDAVSILTTAAKAAKAGNATTTDSINLLSAVTKGYGDTSAEAVQKASDLSFITVKLGQTSFPELASSLGKVVPLASALKVSQEDLYGVFATLTGVTGSTAEVATQYKAVLSGLMTPSKDMTASLKKLGYATADSAIEALGFNGTLQALMGTVGGDTQKMAKLFSSVEAQTAILALCGAQADTFTEKTAAMYEVAGATDAAFQKQTATLQSTIAGIKNLGTNFLTSVGQKILPYVNELAEQALPLVQKGLEWAENKVDAFLPKAQAGLEKLMPKVEKGVQIVKNLASKALPVLQDGFARAISTVQALIPKVLPLLQAGFGEAVEILQGFGNTFLGVMQSIGEHWNIISKLIPPIVAFIAVIAGAIKVIKVIKTIKTAISGLGLAFKLLTNPIGIAIAVIALLVAAGVAIYQNWDAIKAAASVLKEKVVTAWNNIKTGVNTAVTALGEKVLSVWENIKTGVGTAISNLVSAFQSQFPLLSAYLSGWWQSVQSAWENVKAIFSSIIDFIRNVFSGNWEAAWQNIVNIFGNLFGMLVNLAKAPINGVISAINGVLSKINSISITIPDWVPGFGGNTLGFSLPTIPMLASGGIVTAPTLAMIGEGNQDEAVLPLDKLSALMEGGPGGGNTTFTFAPVIHLESGMSAEEVQQVLEDERRKFERQMNQWMKDQKRRKFASV